MNLLTVNSRKFFREHRNGSTFSTDTSVYSSFFKANTLERVKFSTSITIATKVLANASTEIQFVQGTSEVFFIHPYLNWNTEGFKIGDTISIRKGALSVAETITALSGLTMTTTDVNNVAATLTIVDGTFYNDLEFYNTTVPTSLNFQFNLVPNLLPPPSLSTSSPNFLSILDGQSQLYSANGISGSPTTMTPTMTPSADISESVDITYISTAADGYSFTFELNHIFRVPFFISDWLANFINQTFPFSFTPPNSWRYICKYGFGTDASDPNEFRMFNDQELNGASGFVGQNFTNGLGDYNIESIQYEDPSANVLNELEVTVVNTVMIQIKKTSGNFAAGEKAILYVSRLSDPTQYSNNANDWDENFVFDSVTGVEGGALVDGDYIKDFDVVINADPTLLDLIFDVDFSTAQKAAISAGEYYGVFVTVGDITLSAALSDSKVVWCDVNQYAKNSDITGLITGNTAELYSCEKTPNGTLYTTDISSWNNRLHQAIFHFNLTKNNALPTSSDFIKVSGIKGQIVSRNSVTGESFVCDEYDIPVSAFIAGVGGGWYQIVNQTNYRNFNIKSTAEANKSRITSEVPGSYQTTQEWIVRWPFVVNWREWQANPNCPTEFYDVLEEMNNMNYRTSNYSGVSNWVIYIRLLVTVNTQGVNTDYGLYSTACTVRDFDVDPPVDNWTATTKLYDENGVECDYLKSGHDMKIKTEMSMATAGALTPALLIASHTIEEYLSTSDNWRLNSRVDWYYNQNLLKPLVGETYVLITQDVPGNKIIIESLVDKDLVDYSKSYNVYTHLEEDR